MKHIIMKKNLIFYTFMLVALILSAQLQAAIPQPLLKYDCEEITDLNQLEPSTGSIIAKITDNVSPTPNLKDDASIETDADRGKVLLLPNLLDASNKGDQPGFYRCLRIQSTESLVGTGDFTLAFWAKVRTQPQGLNGFPAMFDFDGATFTMRHVAHWNGSKLSLRTNKDINSTVDPTSFIYDWSFYAIVKEGTNLMLYINNALIGSNTTYNIDNAVLKNLRFNGTSHGGGTLLDDIQIFGVALSAAQIAEIYTPAAKVNITAIAYPAAGGSTTGTGDISVGAQHTITATANPGYQFAWWAENGYNISTESTYNFEVATRRQFYAYFKPDVPEALPNFEIKGTNYEIKTFAKSEGLFPNRPAVVLGDIPADFANWKFTKINANSTYLPGPLPTMQVKPDKDGDIYVLVATGEKPDVCATWATTNGWELVPVYKISYGDGELSKLSLYKKQVTKDVWFDVVQPSTFSGAIIIAPDIKEEPVQGAISAVPVSIQCDGRMETADLKTGAIAFSNRTYIFSTINPLLKGNLFTRFNGGAAPKLSVKALADGDLYIAVADEDNIFSRDGWTKEEELGFSYNDGTNSRFSVYKKTVSKDDIIKIETTSWYGILVISPEIDYKEILMITPPPGTVIHNSKAETHKYVGSPSITVLPDGTYIASHDYFGGFISDSFIYKSEDKGKSWERIAEIKKLTWSTLFTRNDELYLFGVQPRCNIGYGNCVILKSTDGGYTWTSPTDASNGLLIPGYYHCAPVPVVFHEGKIWRAMEEQGSEGGWGPFYSFMMSIDEDADLLNAENWTKTNKILYSFGSTLSGSSAWLEGNAVIAKDGSVKNILRVAYNPDDKAAVVRISADGKTASFNPQKDFVTFPGSGKKFTIRFDKESNKYWTLTNYVLEKNRGGDNGGTRNTVTLVWSDDLVTWNIKDTLLHHPDVATHGFQYLDWQFDGNDIIAASRTAWEDETGNPPRQHDANYLTFHRFTNFRYDRVANDPSVEVKKWQNGASSAFALTFDDGFKGHYDHAFPVLKEYNIEGTFFVNSGKLVHESETPVYRYGFWEDFKSMAEEGQEIASHSVNHPDLTSLGLSELTNELKKDKENIEKEIPSQLCLTHAYPFCLRNDHTDFAMKDLFIAGRACGNLQNNASQDEDNWYRINSELLTWTAPRSLANDEQSATRLKNTIQSNVIASNKFGVACIHEVIPFNQLGSTDSYEPATTEWLTNICRFLDEKRTAGEIWPTTFANIVRYAKERDNLRMTKTALDDKTLQYEFTDWLDDEIYNVPVSISIAFPNEWTQVNCNCIMTIKCEVIENDVVISSKQYTNGDGKTGIINVIPDKTVVKLTVTNETGLSNNIIPEISHYPNPVKDILNISLNDPIDGYYAIYDMQGRKISQKNIQSPGKLLSVDLGYLSSGLYAFQLSTKEGILYNFKITKQ